MFACDALSDEVLPTLGQSFLLAQDLAARKRARPKKQQYMVIGEQCMYLSAGCTRQLDVPVNGFSIVSY